MSRSPLSNDERYFFSSRPISCSSPACSAVTAEPRHRRSARHPQSAHWTVLVKRCVLEASKPSRRGPYHRSQPRRFGEQTIFDCNISTANVVEVLPGANIFQQLAAFRLRTLRKTLEKQVFRAAVCSLFTSKTHRVNRLKLEYH